MPSFPSPLPFLRPGPMRSPPSMRRPCPVPSQFDSAEISTMSKLCHLCVASTTRPCPPWHSPSFFPSASLKNNAVPSLPFLFFFFFLFLIRSLSFPLLLNTGPLSPVEVDASRYQSTLHRSAKEQGWAVRIVKKAASQVFPTGNSRCRKSGPKPPRQEDFPPDGPSSTTKRKKFIAQSLTDVRSILPVLRV